MKIGDKVKLKSISELEDDGSCGLMINGQRHSVDNLPDVFDSYRLYMLIICGFELELNESEVLKLSRSHSTTLDDMFPNEYNKNK